MSQGPYGTWPPQGVKSEAAHGSEQFNASQSSGSVSRRAGSGGAQQSTYGYPEGYAQTGSSRRFIERGNVRPPSSSPTSSLSGAMGDAHISSQYQSSAAASGMAWTSSSYPLAQGDYVMVPNQEGTMQPYLASPPTSIPSASPSGAFSLSQQYSTYPNISSGTMSSPASGVPSLAYAEQFAYQQSQARSIMQTSPDLSPMTPSSVDVPMSAATVPISRSSRSMQEKRLEDEIRRLQQKVQELEIINESARQRMKDLEREVSRGGYRSGGSSSASGAGALPSPVQTPTSMQENWRARTDARVKIFCSLNRAGNALCAWHDSRRERRAFPPRMAPPGHLNCGCSFEQALFEESLARHGVGSYHPGENVRMDPALRNPLLQLLQQRYSYQDGDFERDPTTGRWVDGEGAAYWEAKLAAGAASNKKTRGDERR